ncbi:MAG: hypothetical protein ACQEQD_04465 [Bacillota bacterium]
MSNGRRKYDDKNNPEPEDFGRRDTNGDIIIDKKKLYNMFCEVKDEIIDLRTIMNNGIVDSVERLSRHTEINSKKIEQLKEKISEMDNKVETHRSYDKGSKDRIKKIIVWGVGIGGWLIALLSFLFGQGIL